MDFFKRYYDVFAFLGISVFISACFINNPVIAGVGFICSILVVTPSLVALFYSLIKYKKTESFLYSETQWYWNGLFLIIATLLYNVGYPIVSLVILLFTVSHLILGFIQKKNNH